MGKEKSITIGLELHYDAVGGNAIQDALDNMGVKTEEARLIPIAAGGLADYLAIGLSFLTTSVLAAFLKEFSKEAGRILAQRIFKTPNEEHDFCTLVGSRIRTQFWALFDHAAHKDLLLLRNATWCGLRSGDEISKSSQI